MNDDSITTMVRHARLGHDDAQNRLLETIRPRVREMAQRSLTGRRSLRRRVSGSDIAQMTLHEVQRDLQGFLGITPQEFAAWLRKIVRHTIADVIKEHRRDLRDMGREVPLDGDTPSAAGPACSLTSPGASPSEVAGQEEKRTRIRQALDRLPDDLREVLRLRRIDDVPMKEIAGRLYGGELRTAYRRYHAAVEAFRLLLPEGE